MLQVQYTPSTHRREFDFAEERLTREEAASYLGMSPRFLEADKKHRIPRVKVGNRCFYMRSDLNEWLLSRRSSAIDKEHKALG
jgi:hypothetical protein